VYVATTAWLRSLPRRVGSLETEHFPVLAGEGRLAGAVHDGVFIDIGLPGSLAEAQGLVAAWRRKPCAFLDRDGVINVDTGHLHMPGEFRWIPGMPEAIKLLNDAGWLVVVVTNQAGIGRGLYTEAEFERFTAWIGERLAEAGAHVDATYHCPHHPTAGMGEYLRVCECRKPAPGMLLRAIAEWAPDVERSFMLGDSDKDMADSYATSWARIERIDPLGRPVSAARARVRSPVRGPGGLPWIRPPRSISAPTAGAPSSAPTSPTTASAASLMPPAASSPAITPAASC
jgi:D-glycero-D-manno-heptose 1,7-bisphosphate phosphatase